MGRLITNTNILLFLFSAFSLPGTAEVRVIDRTKKTQEKINAESTEKAEKANSDRNKNVNFRYVLENRETGAIVTFHESTIDEVVENLRAAHVPIPKWHSCSSKKDLDETVDLEEIEKQLDMNLLIESLAKVPAPELTDSQVDWVKTLSPCKADMRLHLKALSLILQNYKVIKKPEA